MPKPDGPLDAAARHRLIGEYLSLFPWPAAAVWKGFRGTYRAAVEAGLTPDDLHAACLFGLASAARLFDPARGLAFGTYAPHHMRSAVQWAATAANSKAHRQAGRIEVSGDARYDDADAAACLFDGLAARPGACPVEAADTAAAVKRALRRLPGKREREVVRLRFGLDGRGVRTLDEIARGYGLVKERVRQIEAAALKRLYRHPKPLERATA